MISQAAEQAGQAAVTVGLPPILGVDLTQLGRACAAEQALARTCPESARVGTVEAATPLLAAPLTGNVYLASRGPAALPGLTIQLADPIPLRLDGAVELTPEGLKTTFTGLPDVPLSRFQLDLAGGAEGVFQLGSDLCVAAPPQVTAAFVAQSGAQAAETKPLAVAGCTPAPKVTAAITRLKSGRPKVRVSVAAAEGAPELRQVRVLLPNALEAKPKRKRAGARARTGAGKLPRKAIKLTKDGELRLDAAGGRPHGDGDAREGRRPRGPQAAQGPQAAPPAAPRLGARRRRHPPVHRAEGPPAPALSVRAGAARCVCVTAPRARWRDWTSLPHRDTRAVWEPARGTGT